jgi:CHAD domain-containing protein
VPRRGGQAVTNDFSLKRAAAFNSAKKVVASERFRLLLISLAEWVENKQSYSRRHDMAIERVRRRLKQVCREGRQLEQPSVGARHKIRICVKKIRYALDFFETVFPGRRQAVARLSKVMDEQDTLGALNDFFAHRQLAADSVPKGARPNGRAGAFVGRSRPRG